MIGWIFSKVIIRMIFGKWVWDNSSRVQYLSIWIGTRVEVNYNYPVDGVQSSCDFNLPRAAVRILADLELKAKFF
jgi:hypothetical protein